MTCEVHEFEPVEGGLRISLTYDSAGRVGKTAGRTDTYRGRFVRLAPHELVVEMDELETADATLAGEIITTIRLEDAKDGGTALFACHERLPDGLSKAENQAGWREALARLAKLVETKEREQKGPIPLKGSNSHRQHAGFVDFPLRPRPEGPRPRNPLPRQSP